MKSAKVFLLTLCLVSCAGHGYATDYYVKQTGRADSAGRDGWANAVDTIHRALERVRADGAAGVRSIHVAAGTYVGGVTLDAGTDNVYLLGGYPADPADGDTRNGALNATTIQCGGGCTAVTIRELSSAAVEGFVIRGGGTYGGDGVRVDNSGSVIIAHNLIEDCIGGYSHGIRWSQSGGSINWNTISNNAVGSGIYINQVREGCGDPPGICQVVISGNRITDNWANNGGGILVVNMWGDEQGNRSPCIIACNSIENNRAYGSGGGIRVVDSSGIRIRRNEVRSNIFNSYGGGISLGNTVASFIEENVISDNTDRAGSSGRGAGISFEDSRAIAFGNIITSNRCNGEGDGVYVRGNSHVPSLGDRVVSPSGNNCIFLNADSDLLYSGTIPGEVYAQNNYWGSADRRLIASRIRGITPSRWNPIVASCRQTESSLRLRCYGHDCTLTPDAFRGCLTPAR